MGKEITRNIVTVLGIVFLTSALGSGCSQSNPASRTEFLLGTPCTVTLYDRYPTGTFDAVFDRVREIENAMSLNVSDSEVNRINSAAGKYWVEVSEDTFYVIKKAVEYYRMSEGAFDITIGPLVNLWGINTDSEKVPSRKEIEKLLPLVSSDMIRLREENNEVFLEKEGMIIDLGGIAKGYAADEASKILAGKDISNAIIDFGGNIFAMGSKRRGESWRIGIQNPFGTRGKYVGIARVIDSAVVTSGVYERYFFEDGVRYHHILDPKTGYPVRNDLMSVSVIAEKSIDADVLSTAVFSLGSVKGYSMASRLDDIAAIFIAEDKEVFTTEGIHKNFKISNSDFTLR